MCSPESNQRFFLNAERLEHLNDHFGLVAVDRDVVDDDQVTGRGEGCQGQHGLLPRQVQKNGPHRRLYRFVQEGDRHADRGVLFQGFEQALFRCNLRQPAVVGAGHLPARRGCRLIAFDSGHQAGQRAADGKHPDRYLHPQHRALPRQRPVFAAVPAAAVADGDAAQVVAAGVLFQGFEQALFRCNLRQPAVVVTLEYDPNRTAHIALVQYEDGEKRYIIAPNGLKVGDTVVSGKQADIKPGNALPAGL